MFIKITTERTPQLTLLGIHLRELDDGGTVEKWNKGVYWNDISITYK